MSLPSIKNFVLLRYPVPTAFGVPGMRAVVLHSTGFAPREDTLYVAHSENEKVLIAAIFEHNGLAQIEKTYLKKGKLDVGRMLRGRRGKGPFELSKTDFEALASMRIMTKAKK